MLFSNISKLVSKFDKSTVSILQLDPEGDSFFYRVSGFVAIKIKLDLQSVGSLKGFYSIPTATDEFLTKSKLSTVDLSIEEETVKVQNGSVNCGFVPTPLSSFPYSVFFDVSGDTKIETMSKLDLDVAKVKADYSVFGMKNNTFFFVDNSYVFSVPASTTVSTTGDTTFIPLQKSLVQLTDLPKSSVPPTLESVDTGNFQNIRVGLEDGIQLVVPYETLADDVVASTNALIDSLDQKTTHVADLMNFSALVKNLSPTATASLFINEEEVVLISEQAEMRVDQYLEALNISCKEEVSVGIALEKLNTLAKFPHNKVSVYLTEDPDMLLFQLDTGVKLWI
jgi:hypothetical protein